jgi:hypothetical protein
MAGSQAWRSTLHQKLPETGWVILLWCFMQKEDSKVYLLFLSLSVYVYTHTHTQRKEYSTDSLLQLVTRGQGNISGDLHCHLQESRSPWLSATTWAAPSFPAQPNCNQHELEGAGLIFFFNLGFINSTTGFCAKTPYLHMVCFEQAHPFHYIPLTTLPFPSPL